MQVTAQRLADQTRGVGILDQSTASRFCAGNSQSDTTALPQLAFDRLNQARDGHYRTHIVALWRWHPSAEKLAPRRVERDDLDLRAAKIDSE